MELPHTAGCLVCGRDNPHGLHLSLHVDSVTGAVNTKFTPQPHHIGFEGVTHGGAIAAVADEAMVWAAIWACRRACLAAELTMRYKKKVAVNQTLNVVARQIRIHPRLVEIECRVDGPAGELVAAGTAKYIPLSLDETADFLRTLVDEPATAAAATILNKLR